MVISMKIKQNMMKSTDIAKKKGLNGMRLLGILILRSFFNSMIVNITK